MGNSEQKAPASPLLLVVTILTVTSAVAQEQFGHIAGVVTDPSGAVVPGVKSPSLIGTQSAP